MSGRDNNRGKLIKSFELLEHGYAVLAWQVVVKQDTVGAVRLIDIDGIVAYASCFYMLDLRIIVQQALKGVQIIVAIFDGEKGYILPSLLRGSPSGPLG